MPKLIEKDPDAVLDYVFDFAPLTNSRDDAVSDWLATGETISTASATVTTGLTLTTKSITDTNTSVTVWLSGGTAGSKYEVTVHITTSSSRQDDRSMTIYCTER